ncbi:MAG: hypothetical protein WAW85_09945 [Gordonia sp. (in: high G+C Gram-positive bacteria)]|uniref:hypothetical protein n=1 Tax=Gordonia sp. (in: high G+C Gram-positive bacteria) TaxID=84139 RepID=UPI003BB751BB
MSDEQIVSILNRSVAIADPILDIIAHSDPLQVKPRTFGRQWWDVIPTRFGDLTATALSAAAWPGTGSWEKLSSTDRAAWWVHRIGPVTSAAPAFPGMFGAWTKKLPASTVLGAASQALVVLAIGREYGIVDRNDEIDLLGAVLFGRDLDGAKVKAVERQEIPDADRKTAVVTALREIGVALLRIDKELGARPQSPTLLAHLTWIPVIGAAASYLGEQIALRKAADATRAWIVAHREAV